jgi:acyl dehydratase
MAEFFHAALRAGDTLPEWTSPPISRHTLALYCGASGDHNPIHVDIDFARAAGMPDVFAHGMLAMAYLGHALTAAVPVQALRSYGVRFVTLTHVGDSLRCSAHVVEVMEHHGERLARLSLCATDQHQQIKLQGDAEIALNALDAPTHPNMSPLTNPCATPHDTAH